MGSEKEGVSPAAWGEVCAPHRLSEGSWCRSGTMAVESHHSSHFLRLQHMQGSGETRKAGRLG